MLKIHKAELTNAVMKNFKTYFYRTTWDSVVQTSERGMPKSCQRLTTFFNCYHMLLFNLIKISSMIDVSYISLLQRTYPEAKLRHVQNAFQPALILNIYQE